MADLSLDDYITSKRQSFPGKLGKRLGNKTRPNFKTKPNASKQNTQFTVTGVGNVKQRLGVKGKIPDARQKILQKTKFVDARARIELKKAQTKIVDVRSKIESAKATRLDARQLLKAKQQKQQQREQIKPSRNAGSVTGPRFMVTGLGNIALKSGQIIQNIPTIESGQGGIFRTIHSSQPTSPSSLNASAVAGNIVKTISNENINYSPDMARGLRITKTMKPRPVTQETTYYDDDDDDDEMDMRGGGMMSARSTKESTGRPIRHNKLSPETGYKAVPSRKQASQQVPATDVVSPAQGYRVVISNLHSIVSEEDIVELFGAIGDIKRARLVKAGTAEVIYKEKSDAQMAVRKYHQRELDGQPMSVVIGTSTTAKTAKPVKQAAPPAQPAEHASSPAPSGAGPLRLGKNPPSDKLGSNVDSTLIHKALFKTSSKEEPNRPVTFTVKI